MSEVVGTKQGAPSADVPSVAVTIVTYNSAKFIAQCLQDVFEQDYPNIQVIVVDNASRDNSVFEVTRFQSRIVFIQNRTNTGFAAGQNLAISSVSSDWVLTLNPDVRMRRDFVTRLIEAGEHDDTTGVVCGKLLSMRDDFSVCTPSIFDSTGIFMTPNLRHLDRGSQEVDDGRFDRDEYVFGATGAAALYRRHMIADISIDGEFFDEDFFAYREDADVAWRAQLLGWRCRYTPSAVAYHVRSVLPANRNQVSPVINMHSVKNRFLLRIKNATAGLYRRFWLPMTMRDFLVIVGCLVREWSSVPGLVFVLKAFRKTLRKRRQIFAKKRASDSYINQWFAFEPVGLPVKQARKEVMHR